MRDFVTSLYLMAFSTLMRSSSVMFCWRQLQSRPSEFPAAGDTNVTDAQSRDVGCWCVVTSLHVLLPCISCCVNLLFCHPAIEIDNYWYCNVSLVLWTVNPHRTMTIMKPVREAKARSGLQRHWWWWLWTVRTISCLCRCSAIVLPSVSGHVNYQFCHLLLIIQTIRALICQCLGCQHHILKSYVAVVTPEENLICWRDWNMVNI
jgi:hypothetical protein